MSKIKKAFKFLEELDAELQSKAVAEPISAQAPSELHFELTYKCDSDCIMCNLKYMKIAQSGEDLSLEDVENIINGSTQLNDIRFILLSGGEPWLNKDFFNILKFLHEKYEQATFLILSNLINREYIMHKLQDIKDVMGLDRISIGTSIDGLGSVHDNIRGSRGAFDRTLETALAIVRRFPELPVSYNFTLMPVNVDQILSVYKWKKQYGFPMSFQLVVQKKETEEFLWDKGKIKKLEKNIKKIMEDIIETKMEGSFSAEQAFNDLETLFLLINFYYILQYAKMPRRFLPNCPCGEKFAMIAPDGNLYFCPVHKDMVAGNVRDEGFDGVWSNSKAGQVRDFFNEKTCHCWLSCTNGIMLADVFFKNKEYLISKLNK